MPTFTHGSTAAIYLTDSGATERNISTTATKVDFPRSADTAETTTFGKTAKTYIPGLVDATFTVEGPHDVTVDGYLAGILGSTTVFAYCPSGSATGKVKLSGTAICTSYGPSSDVGDANRYSAEFQVTDVVTRTVL